MNIEELLGGNKETVVLAAMKHPALKASRNPSIEQALKAVASEAEACALRMVSEKVLPELQDVLDMYVIMNGDYEDMEGDEAASSREDYASGLDDKVEEALEPFEAHLSADWLAKNTIDVQLWQENAVEKLAKSVGKETFKQLSYDKTPAQVLSSAGIVKADVEIYFEQHLNASPKEKEKKMVEEANDLAGVVAKIKAHIGTGYDIMAVFGDIELACDDDEILAGGGAQRLGIDTSDCMVLQMASLEHGSETAQVVSDMVEAAKAPKKKAAKKKKPVKAGEPVEGAIDPQVLVLLKDHGGAQDTATGKELGVSRATYNNYVNGKTSWQPDSEQHDYLRGLIVAKTNGMLEALALLDGTDRMEIS